MQGAAGTRLDQQVREKGALPYERAAQIAEEVLAQVDLLAQRGEFRALSGISLARILLSPNGQVVLLRSSDELPAVVSAPAYASPEEIRGDSPNVQSAIYSLGCALFELLTGRPPFMGKDPKAVLRSHLSAPAPDLTSLRPDLPAALSHAVASFLAKDPARRPLDATHAIGLLRTALGGAPEEVPPPPPVRPNALPRRTAAAPRSAPVARGASGAAVGSAPVRSGAVPVRGANSPLHSRGGVPAPSRPGLPAGARTRGGGSPTRGAAGATRHQDGSGRPGFRRPMGGPAPPPATWIFTWAGLGLGVLLSLIFIASDVMKNQAPQPGPALATKEEKDAVDARRAAFKKSAAEEAEIALREFRNLPARLSFAERAGKLKELLDRYNHTPAAREMVETYSMLCTQAAEAAANPGRAGHEENAAPVPSAGPVQEGPAAPNGAQEASPVDGIDLPGKKDDGTTDL